QTTVGANIHPGVSDAVQLEVKRQRNKRIAFIAIVADVCVTCHDPICPLSYDVLATTLDRVGASEGVLRVTQLIGDRTGDALRQAAAGPGSFRSHGFSEVDTRLFNRAYEHGSV